MTCLPSPMSSKSNDEGSSSNSITSGSIARDRHLLLLAAGELARVDFRLASESDHLEKLLPALDSSFGPPSDGRSRRNITQAARTSVRANSSAGPPSSEAGALAPRRRRCAGTRSPTFKVYECSGVVATSVDARRDHRLKQ